MQEQARVPAIRFAGFRDDWEQRKFSEITFPAGIKNKDNLPLESYSITNESGFVPQDEKFENGGTMREADKRMYYIVAPHSFAYNPARINVGSIGYQNLDKNVIVSSLYEVFQTTDDIDDRFLWHWFKSSDFQKLIEQLQEGGVRLYFYYDKLRAGTLSFPSLKEQQRIGQYLDNLDHLITLHQRKYSRLCNVKKSMLEKMFPKDGASMPEIRFAGFTDAWEQRKLSELIVEYKETVEADCELPVLTSSKTEGVLLQEEHFGRKQSHDITGYNVLPRNYCTYRNRSDGIDFTFNINKCCDKGIISKFYPVFCGKDNDTFFISLVLNNGNEVVREIGYTCTGTGQKVLSFSDLLKMYLRVPNYEEQKKIAVYFDSLDHLITLHQRELERLQNIKKACLEKMFV
ncbi:restriction endonuclease subunit S [Butyricicoccus sp. 1XD8-22]|nr:restriction endonuclease subunit S [Butyricicoccus sp. 1XD8-22]